MGSTLLLVACLAVTFAASFARVNVGHYKGGSITWKADDDNPSNVNIFYRVNFRHAYRNGYLHEACTNQDIQDRTVLSTEGIFSVDGRMESWAKYICTDYDETMDWSAGYYIMPYTLAAGQTKAEVNFQECCWPTTVQNNGNVQGSGRGFNLVSTIDISPRPDTGKPNNPPVAGSFPVYRFYRGCKYTRYIRAWDADGDKIRCRWTDVNKDECNANDGDICGDLYVNKERNRQGAILEEDTCKITFGRRNPAGTYAVAVMIEDYTPSDPTTPLSRIPVQFLIEVLERDGKCAKPLLLGEDGTCTTIPAGRETQFPLRARSSTPTRSITSFETIKPSGVHASPIRRVDGTNDEYSVTLSWVPTRDQIGRHVICYEAEEAHKYSTDMFCMYVNVVDEADLGPQLAVLPYESVPAPGTSLTGDMVTITYNREIQRPGKSAFISLLDESNLPLKQFDTTTADVSFLESSLTFQLPSDLPLQRGGVYKIRVDESAVKSAVDCEAAPEAAEWSFVFESFCDGNFEPLVISPSESVPAPGAEMVGNVVSITYNNQIQKTSTSAYVTIYDSRNSPLFRIDTSSADATVSGKTLSFTVPMTLPLVFQGRYKIRVDEGAVVNARECDQDLPAMAEWDFVFVTFCMIQEETYEPLMVLPIESLPAPGENFAGQTMRIKYNKEIQKAEDSAYITILDAFNLSVLQIDTSTPDVSIEGDTLSFVLSVDLPLQFGGGYRIQVDEGAVRSAQDCDLVLPPAAEWEFGFVTFCAGGQDYEPLSVLPMESSPYPGENFAGRVMQIGYNKQIKKPLRPAYISIFDSTDSLLYQIDAASPDATIVDETSLRFTLPLNLPLEFQGVYKIRVDGWAAVSAQDCDVSRPDTAEWRFTFLTYCQHGGRSFEPLAVLPLESQPRPGGNISGHEIIIQYNKLIQKPASSSYVTILDSEATTIYAVDTTSDGVMITGNSLVFSLPAAAAVAFGSDYRVVVDDGAARSAESCDTTLPAGADWRFKWTGRVLPGELNGKPVIGNKAFGSADCRENFMQTFVSKRLVGEIDPSTMYLNDKSCNGKNHNKTHYVIGTSYDACQTVPQYTKKGNMMTFDNVVYIPPQPYTPGSEITRDHFIEIHLTCHVPADKVSYVSFDPNVTTIVYYEEGYGNFNFSLKMYQDDSYSAPFRPRDYPVGVQLNQAMNFEGRVTCDGNCDLMIDNCWATPTSNPFDVTRFPFITNGCPIDDTVRLLDSPSSKKERFAIDSFAFLGDNIHGTVFVHCDMRICDVNDPNSRCTMGCEAVDQSQTDSPIQDNNVLRPHEGINRGDVPRDEEIRRKRDVSNVGSSSAAYSSTAGQLRLGGEQIDVKSDHPQMAVDPDVVEIAMLGAIIVLLVVLVFMQCRRALQTTGKTSTVGV